MATEDTRPLQEFMIGKWASSPQVTNPYGTYIANYHVEFTSTSTLRFGMESSYENFDDNFSYYFVDENTIKVENERAKNGQWTISRSGDDLLLCIWTSSDCYLFTRELK
jgi:hypothetical protein